MKTIIMDDVRIERTLKRIAFQILENCYQEEEVTVDWHRTSRRMGGRRN